MGNKLARTTQVSPSEYYLHDLPSSYNLVLKEALGGGRFLKSIQCVHDEGLLLVKVYFKRGEFINLKEYEKKLYEIREKLKDIQHSHVWPFQYWLETDKAAYLLRQYFFSNLHDRISTRPFLSIIEKKWLAFQLLHALKQIHERGICHGDIKCENVLVTSWNWVYLADFYGSLKPTYLPVDNPADFSFFFDTGGRRRCYLAPERFYEPNTDTVTTADVPLKPAMDIFSLGCVIGELFLEGKALFDLSQLLAYRRGQYDPRPSLEKIPDVGVREMIMHMIQLNEETRFSAGECLHKWTPTVFRAYYSPLLHNFFSCLVPLDTDTRVAVTQGAFPEIRKQMLADLQMRQQSQEVGGIADVVSSKGVSLSPSQKKDELPAGDFIVDQTPSMDDSTHHLLEGSGYHKDDITLPSDGGGRWDRDWEVDSSWADSGVGADAEGWKYRKMSIGDSELDMGAGPKSEAVAGLKSSDANVKQAPSVTGGWSADCSPNCVQRQRRWIRHRCRWPCQPMLASPAMSEKQLLSESKEVEVSLESLKLLDLSLDGGQEEAQKCEGMVLIASLLCACLRNVKLPQARRGAIQLLHDSSLFIEDDARLQLVIPYVVALLSDTAAIVRCAALQTLCNVLSMVQVFPPSDAKIFPEYILPLLSMLPDDTEESVRIVYAANIHKIAETSYRFMMCSKDEHETGSSLDVHSSRGQLKGSSVERRPSSFKVSVGAGMIGHPVGRMELELGHLRDAIARVIQELVMGQKQTPTIRRALLQHIGSFCQFFGPRHSNDFLLPILPAFLNDHDEQLRATFFKRIVHVCLFVGQMSLETYLLPCIEQALNDVEETVIVNAMECLAALCTHRLLRKRVLLEAVERASPLLCHPSEWVQRAAIILVAATSANLEPADSYAFLMPILGPFLRREPASLCSEVALLACLKPPVSREVFNRVLGDVMLLQTERETAATAKHSGKKTKGRRVAPIQPPPELVGIISNRPAKERRRPDRDGGKSPAGSRDLSQSALKNGAKQAPVSVPPFPSFLKPVAGVSEGEDGEKMKAMEGYICNLSSIMQSRMHNWEAGNTEKLQSSSIGFTAGVGAGFYSNYGGSSEGIPLYSVPLIERKSGEGMPVGQGSAPQGVDGNPSTNEDWSRVFGTHQGSAPFLMATIAGTPISGSIGPASSQWANIGVQSSLSFAEASMQRSPVAMTGSFTPRLLAGSVYQGIGSASQHRFDSVNDVGRYDSGEGLLATGFRAGVHSISTSKANLASPSHMVSAGGKSGEAAPVSTDASIGVAGIPFLSSSGAPESPWRPRGVLIAHLQEHQGAVNDVTVSADNIFFASASDDGTVKIWDCRRLERDISFRSRVTYPLQAEGRALHVTMLGNGHHVGAASGDGTIHVFAVDYVAHLGGSAECYTGISNTCKLDTQEGNILSLQNFSNDGPPQLLYSTQCNGVHLWDLRTQTDVWTLRAKPAQGFISTTALDPACNWLVSGTSRGMLTLWDLRFQVPVNTWQHPACCPVESICVLIPGTGTVPLASAHPFVYVAAGRNEVALWNAEDGTCHQVLRLASETDTGDVNSIPAALSQPSSSSQYVRPGMILDSSLNGGLKVTDYRIEELNEPPPRLPGVRALLPLSGGAGLLTGGSDCCIHMWDHSRPEHSYSVCGPATKNSTFTEPPSFEVRAINGVRVVQEVPGVESGSHTSSKSKTSLATAATDSAGCHQDCILGLASAQTNQRLLISSSRDGALKVWK
ncbi:hypothetical protein BDL97_15G033100 [Sphagnum fallax]|nr:hypothetical protein BDL97_15G033100 [Sphagnum fallax]